MEENYVNYFEKKEPKKFNDLEQETANYNVKLKRELAQNFTWNESALKTAYLEACHKYPQWQKENLTLKKLLFALSVWRSLPVDFFTRYLMLKDLEGKLNSEKKLIEKKHIEKKRDSSLGDLKTEWLALDCFLNYHVDNTLLLKKHWHNCFFDDLDYHPTNYWYDTGLNCDHITIQDFVGNLNDGLLYVDFDSNPNKKLPADRFFYFVDRLIDLEILKPEDKILAQRFFDVFSKKAMKSSK